MKISRRLVKIILDLFQTKPWFVRPRVNLAEFSRSISSSTFVKIFRIFFRGIFLVIWRRCVTYCHLENISPP